MQRSYKLYLISLFLLNIYSWISIVESTFGIPSIVKYVIVLFVLVTIFYTKISNPSKPVPESLFYPVIVLFTIYSSVLLFLACLKIDGLFYIQRLFGQRYFFLPYLIPLPLIYTKFDLNFFENFFYYTYKLILPAILIALYIIATGINSGDKYVRVANFNLFDLGGSFLIMTSHVAKKKSVSYFALTYAILVIIIALAHGRRTTLIEYLLFMLFMIVIRLKSKLLTSNDRMRMYFLGLLLIICSISFGYLLNSSFAFQRGFSKEGFIESRGDPTEAFF